MKEKVEKKGDTGIKPTHSGIKQTHIHEIHYSIYIEIRYSVCMCTIIIALWRSMELPLHKIQRDPARHKERGDQQLLQAIGRSLADAFTDLPDDAHSANRQV